MRRCSVVGFVCLALTTHARADTVPALPAPFVLPELTHPGHQAAVDWFVGSVDGAATAVVRPSFEANLLVPRRVFFGLAYPLATGRPADLANGSRVLPGNVEAHARAVFMLPSAFEVGFSFSVIAPTALFDRTHANRSVAAAATSFDPTSEAQFLRDRTTLRPAGDLRIRRGPIVLQARHGIDILIDGAAIERASAAGRLLGHIGYLITDQFEFSLEGSQNYSFATTPKSTDAFEDKYRVSDDRRSAVTFGPGLRLTMPELDIGAALVTTVGPPVSPAASGVVALRVSASVHFGN